MYPLALFIIAVLGSGIHFKATRSAAKPKRMIELFLSYMIPLNIGAASIFAFICHAFFGPEVARMIGWPAHNPFQFEIAMANLSFGVIGFLSIWQRRGFWLATALANAIFLWGAAYGHFVQMAKGDLAPYNSGIFLYIGDIIIPFIFLVLTLIYSYQNRSKL